MHGAATVARCVPCIAVAPAPTVQPLCRSQLRCRTSSSASNYARHSCYLVSKQGHVDMAVHRPKHPEARQGRLRDQETAEDPLAGSGKDGGRGEGEGSPHWLRCDLSALKWVASAEHSTVQGTEHV